ncbi:39S ribosomal protein L55, mitochondrial isoform X2 [Rousettus aegyptiacus]|uniref:Mitochondrial ribosomal protein L55 n=1 Tax=Rousettus aegyptiacus TaxID=9407 RepID=A0A7J8FJY4_ROUAE|nr:39S ribosomal protein L55, mitochondrial isoform X2 [Rousettus aegyptiacus]KAF6448047.1 mitochondrial ribosomal protein L55 [Rousettus aegyptiacus]
MTSRLRRAGRGVCGDRVRGSGHPLSYLAGAARVLWSSGRVVTCRASDLIFGPFHATGPSEGMAAVGSLLGLLRQHVVTRVAPVGCHLHTSSWWADSSRALLTRVHRQVYARLYPVLLVKKDGSTIHIRYREPRRMLEMPVDLDVLSPEERRARLRKREAQFQDKKEEPELGDDFDMERYKQFWAKK